MQKSTSNLGFAAYLMILGHKMTDNPSKDESGKFSFFFDISKEDLDNLFLHYTTSDFQKFDNALVLLKRKLTVNTK